MEYAEKGLTNTKEEDRCLTDTGEAHDAWTALYLYGAAAKACFA